MNGNLAEVFNTYNVNILFTVAALPSKVSVGGPGPMMAMPPGATQGGNASLIVPGIPQGNNQKQPSVIQGQVVQQPLPKQMIEQSNSKQQAVKEVNQIAKTFGDEDDHHDSEAQLLISRKARKS
jgi:hypothetical protein